MSTAFLPPLPSSFVGGEPDFPSIVNAQAARINAAVLASEYQPFTDISSYLNSALFEGTALVAKVGIITCFNVRVTAKSDMAGNSQILLQGLPRIVVPSTIQDSAAVAVVLHTNYNASTRPGGNLLLENTLTNYRLRALSKTETLNIKAGDTFNVQWVGFSTVRGAEGDLP